MSTISSSTTSTLPVQRKITSSAFANTLPLSDSYLSASTVNNPTTISTQWGFKVDSNGYFGADFNAAAGLPSGVKIHQNTLATVAKSMQTLGSSQDPISALGTAWKNFTKISGNSLDPDGSMSVSQVLNMPNSFVVDSSIYGNVVSVQQTLEENLTVQLPANDIVTLSNGDFQTGLTTFFGMWKNSGDEVTGELTYKDVSCWKDIAKSVGIVEDEGNRNPDEISVGNLFSVFVEISGRFETPADAKCVSKVEDYFKFVQTGERIEDYAKRNYGEAFYNETMKGYGKTADGKFSQELVDLLLQECNKKMQTDARDYQTVLEKNTPQRTVENPEVRNYIIYRDQTPSSGSLISVSS